MFRSKVIIFQGLAVKAGMLQKIPSPSSASLTRKWWKQSKIRGQKEEHGSKAVVGSKMWKQGEQTGRGGPCKAFPVYLLGNPRERRAQSSSLVAWLGDARAPVPPAPCPAGTSCQKTTSGKGRADTAMAVMPLWTTWGNLEPSMDTTMSYLAEAHAEPCSIRLAGEGKYSTGTGGLCPPLLHPSHSRSIFLSLNPSVLCQQRAQDTPDSGLTPCPFPRCLWSTQFLEALSAVLGGVR